MKRIILLAAAGILLAVGAIGALVPVLPTTPFVLLSASLYSASSPRLYRWLCQTRYFGEFIANYRDKRGVSRRTKTYALCWLYLALGLSAWLTHVAVVRWILLAVAICVSAHILLLRTKH